FRQQPEVTSSLGHSAYPTATKPGLQWETFNRLIQRIPRLQHQNPELLAGQFEHEVCGKARAIAPYLLIESAR
ncbi:MAG: hypothetical protein WC943_07025, partial [Elusimicrobiota bacterium]